MTDHSESKKNLKAGSYTAVVCGVLLVLFLFVRWSLPVNPPEKVDEGIEVNLGSSDQGLGDDQPFEPGSPAPATQTAYTPPAATASTPDDNVKDIETDDNDADAPEIKKPVVTKPNATKIPEREVVKTKPTNKPVENPTPPAPRPKTVMKGFSGTGTGGNEADTYKKGGNQGIAGGQGDQGRPGGNPNSNNYTGGGSGNGLRIGGGLKGRTIVRYPSFKDDFNQNETVAVSVKVDRQGNVLSASYLLKGSSTSESYFKERAIHYVRNCKLNADPNGPEEQVGTILVNFKVRG